MTEGSVHEQHKHGLPKPVLNAMLICDRAFRDPVTSKITLQGIFETIWASAFPAQHPLLSVYVKMTDAEGTYPFRFPVVHLETGQTIGTANGDFPTGNRMAAVELIFDIKGLVFPAQGTYEFQLHVDGRYLGSKTVTVLPLSSRLGGA